MRSEFVPVLTSKAGGCLTLENWQEVGVNTIAYALESLIFKPGQALLLNTKGLKAYLGWSGALALNASTLQTKKEGIYQLTSPFDGSKINISYSELVDLVLHINPDLVLLPKKITGDYPDIWTYWSDSVFPYICVDDLELQRIDRSHGVYFNGESPDLLEQIAQWSHLPGYLLGNVSKDLIKQLKNTGIRFIESDEPAQSGFQGIVYSQNKSINLTDAATELQFETIDTDCACPTCSQQLTKSYLHHLILHTPLLAQRFLIQHNVYLHCN